jgi:protein gp37
MAETTGIAWTDSTWNPWVGCRPVSAGCLHCYMERDQVRRGIDPHVVRRTSPRTFNAPLRWPAGNKVFVCSYSDFWIEEADPWRADAWDVMRRRPDLIFQIPTKRPQRIMECLPADWGNGWPNVWLGVTIEDVHVAWRWESLLAVPAAIRWISWEPAIGPFPILPAMNRIDWIVSGGESGPGARRADPQWFTDIAVWTRKNRIPLFHKQNGGTLKIDGAWGGDELMFYGAPMRIREFPKVPRGGDR